MRKTALVRLTPGQRAELTGRLEREALNGRRRRHLQILLLADGGRTDEQIASATGASRSTVERHRTRFAREGLEAALADKPRSGAPAKLDGKQEAMIVALACSDAPEGRARWTAKLLANRAVELEVVESISESTVRRVLKKTRCSPGRSGRGASPRSAASSWRGWRTCWSCTPSRTTRRGRWSAWTS
jgi:transposase